MPRIRTIKPEFPQSESMGRVSRNARLTFVQLFTICDDAGRARASLRMLASLLFPYDADAPELIEGWIEELEREKCVTRYAVRGDNYLALTNWEKHQRIDRPTKSNIPAPRILARKPRALASPREDSWRDQGPRTKEGIEDQGPRTKDRESDAHGFEAFYSAYPRKVSRAAAEKAFEKALAKTTVETLIAAAQRYADSRENEDPKYTKHAASWLNQECWTDEPERPRAHAGNTGSGGLSAVRGIMTALELDDGD